MVEHAFWATTVSDKPRSWIPVVAVSMPISIVTVEFAFLAIMGIVAVGPFGKVTAGFVEVNVTVPPASGAQPELATLIE